jgi:hypothetical protein
MVCVVVVVWVVTVFVPPARNECPRRSGPPDGVPLDPRARRRRIVHGAANYGPREKLPAGRPLFGESGVRISNVRTVKVTHSQVSSQYEVIGPVRICHRIQSRRIISVHRIIVANLANDATSLRRY